MPKIYLIDVTNRDGIHADGVVSDPENYELYGYEELVRYANVESQKPLVEDELLFSAKYPEIAKKLLTLEPLE